MSARLKFKKFQIVLLEIAAANKDPKSVHIPGYVRHGFGGDWSAAYAKRKRAWQKREHALLLRRIAYLKRKHYLELKQEGEERLYRLTTKGAYEILRLQFALHMQAQRQQPWDGNFYLIIFDVPELLKKYRDFFRKLLRRNGFTMLQLSVWVTRYNPRPAIIHLLKYLDLEKYFEIIKISCKECSPRVRRKIRS